MAEWCGPARAVAGQPGWHSGEVDQEIERAGGTSWIQRTGYVDDDTLAALYNAATVVAYPSLLSGSIARGTVAALKAGAP